MKINTLNSSLSFPVWNVPGVLSCPYSSLPSTGVCCASLEEPKALMKMGLSMLLIGHVNFLLGALVHGVVLRHINLHKQARAMEYAISNVVALTSGLVVRAQTHNMHTLILQQFCKFKTSEFDAIYGNIREFYNAFFVLLSWDLEKETIKENHFHVSALFYDFPMSCQVIFPSELWLHSENHQLHIHSFREIVLKLIFNKYCRKLSEW